MSKNIELQLKIKEEQINFMQKAIIDKEKLQEEIKMH